VWTLLALSLVLRLAVAWWNYGFLALDDYTDIIVSAVPSQQVDAHTVIETSGIRSPIPRLAMLGLVRVGLTLGIDDSLNQVRWMYAWLGLLSMLAVAGGWWLFHHLGRPHWGLHAIVWGGLHFLAIYLSTRALIETMAAPLLLVTAVASVCYAQSGRRGWLAGAMAALVLASVFRFQAGAIVVVLLVLPVIRRQWGDLIVVLAVGLAGFLLTGWVDWLLRGGFHISLRRYLDFNIGQSSSFGVSPWYNYTLLLLAVSLPPVLVSRYRGFDWRSYLRLLWPAIALFGVFVIVHSMTPHKEDRFMAPIMPVFFMLLAPLSAHLWRARPRGWRTLAFVAINATMIVLLVAVPAQYNVIGPVRYFRTHPTITRVWAIQPSMEAWPVAYSERPSPVLERVDTLPQWLLERPSCNEGIVVRSDALDRVQLDGYREAAVFGPGIPERLVIMINPKHNTRRNPIHLFVPVGCGGGSQ